VRGEAINLLAVLGVPQNDNWKNAVATAKEIAANDKASLDYRKDATKLLALDKNGENAPLFEQLISNANNDETLVQTAIYAFQ
jgi:glutathione peroxidase-family protein